MLSDREGSWLRGLRRFNVDSAYRLLLRNATIEGGTRPYITEYNDKGYISTPDIANPVIETKAKAGVTKTLEYAYDDYAVALLARALAGTANYRMLMKRTGNYKNVFDPEARFMRGRLADGSWVIHFYAGMDDAGEMSSWYVFNAMGFYPFSPADPRYIVSVPLFRRIDIQVGDNKTFTILKTGDGKKIVDIRLGQQKIQGYFISDKEIKAGNQIVINTTN